MRLRYFVVSLLCIFFAFLQAGQAQSTCTLIVKPQTGPHPLFVTAVGSCTGAFSYTIDWGEGAGQESFTSPGTHEYFTPGTFTVTLRGFDDGGGLVGSATATVTVTNAPPSCTLSVVPTRGQAPLSVTATVNCTDPENDISSIVIDWGDGTSDQLCGDGCPTPPITATHTYNTPGTFFVSVTATDAFGAQGTSPTVTVTVLGPPPTVTSVKPPQGTQGTNLTVQVSGTNFVVTRGGKTQFAFGSGITVLSDTINSPSSATVNISIAGNAPTGPHDVTATNPDKQSGTCSGCFTVVVSAGPNPTSVVPPNGTQGQSLTVRILGTNFAATPTVSFSGTGITVGAVTFVSSTEVDVPITISATATVGARNVTVTNPNGQSGTCSGCFTVVSAVNKPPICSLSVAPVSGTAGSTVFTAIARCSDPENDINKITISWGDGTSDSIPVTAGTANPSFTKTHIYATAGTFTVTVIATDTANNSSVPASQQVVVAAATNTAPGCTLVVAPVAGNAPLTVSGAAVCTDPQNNISSIVIQWGDKTSLNGSSGSHTYNSTGIFTVSVIATDTGGLTGTASQDVTVNTLPFLFVGVSNGQIKALNTDGSVAKILDTTQGGTITGMAFDSQGSLYSTDFTANNVTKFDAAGNLKGSFGQGYNCKPESITFDSAGNAYVGQADCSHAILKFDSFGNPAGTFQVQVEDQGSDWIDLAGDQCTIFYTSEGTTVKRFNACTNQQLPDFSSSLKQGLAVRVLSDGGVLVANKTDMLRLDSSGKVQTTYTAPGEACWVALTLDPDGTSFWAADFCTSDIVKFDIATGGQLAKLSGVSASNTVFSVAMRSPLTAGTSAGTLTASPASNTVSAGSSATFLVNLIPSAAASGKTLQLSCVGLPVGADCSFSPPAFNAGSMPISSTLTITTHGTMTASAFIPGESGSQLPPLYAAWLPFAAVAFLGSGASRRLKNKKLRNWLAALLPILLFIAIVGCAGARKPVSPGTVVTVTPAGSYSVTVVAGSGSLQSSTGVTLVVK